MRKITLVVIGAGSRAQHAYAPYALRHPDDAQIVAFAEPDIERSEIFAKQYGISSEMSFKDWRELLEREKLADAVLISTQDQMHFEPAIKALEKGYHVLLEKPMSPDPKECVIMGEYARRYDRIFAVCHVLRYTSFFSALKNLLDEGRIGQLVSIQHNENVAYWHQAHSFVRGNWRNSKESSPMILAKSCHDMDILLWLAGANCEKISSFGSLTHFKKENAPEGAAQRCLDGCPAEKECPYYAPKLYLTDNINWPTSAISNDLSLEGRIKALKEGPYGRCVYRCDNDVVDHQVVNMEFSNGVTAAFTMCAFTNESGRSLKLMGTKGEIRAVMEKNEIEIKNFNTGSKEVIYLKNSVFGHGGGDDGVVHNFVRLVQEGSAAKSLTSADVSVQSHLMAFAAEKSRLENKVIDIRDYARSLQE